MSAPMHRAELEVRKGPAGKRLELERRIADGGNEEQTRENEPGHDHPQMGE